MVTSRLEHWQTVRIVGTPSFQIRKSDVPPSAGLERMIVSDEEERTSQCPTLQIERLLKKLLREVSGSKPDWVQPIPVYVCQGLFKRMAV
jgi:hypothetical protein